MNPFRPGRLLDIIFLVIQQSTPLFTIKGSLGLVTGFCEGTKLNESSEMIY
jgi:hypothetical protein